MAVKVKLGSERRYTTGRSGRPLWQRALLFFVAIGLIAALIGGIILTSLYSHYRGVVDARLSSGPLFASTAQVYAAPREVRPGQKLTADLIAADLRRAGYNSNPNLGTYQLSGDSITIKPGRARSTPLTARPSPPTRSRSRPLPRTTASR